MPQIHLGVYMTSGRECESAVSHALEAGYLAIDSAEWYANEKEVGRAIKKYLEVNKEVKREDLWFTTKLKSNAGYDATRKAVKDSLKKSGLDYIDLYLLHSPYGGKEKRLDCWKAVEDAILEGEVKAGGVSNFGVKHVCCFRSPSLNPIPGLPFVFPTLIVFFLLSQCLSNGLLFVFPALTRLLNFVQ
jgi:diketogulonate reductase-like aldo/keto reductase